MTIPMRAFVLAIFALMAYATVLVVMIPDLRSPGAEFESL